MSLKDNILWKPQRMLRLATLGFGALLLTLVAWLHYHSGLNYDFHLLFILPVLLVAWFAGALAGYGLAFFAILIWYVADRMLLVADSGSFPIFFNKGMQLTIFIAGVWLLRKLRILLESESRLAREDSLTGLPCRREFYEQGKRALALAHRQQAPLTAVFIDLDRFKEVNDTLGHEVGDTLLVAVAQVMQDHLRASDLPGRLGGDEFSLILPGMDGEAAAHYVEELRQRLLAVMQQGKWPVTFSIGIASFCRAPDNFERVLSKADALMYEVKNSGRDSILLRECSSDSAGFIKKSLD